MGKKLTQLERLERELLKAERDSKKACARRGALPPGSSRAAITTANARWWCLAEYRDKVLAQYEAAGGDGAAVLARAAQNG